MSNTDSEIILITGNETFSHNSSKIHAWVMPTEGKDKNRTPVNRTLRVTGHNRSQACKGNRSGFGAWNADNYEIKDGTIILIQAIHSVNSATESSGSLLLMLRKDAALITINATLPPSPRSIWLDGLMPVFSGRADVLSVEEATLLSVDLRRGYITTYMEDQEELDELYSIEVVQKERKPKQKAITIMSADGPRAVMVDPQPRRRLRLRK